LCQLKCSSEKPYENIKNQQCIKNCNINDIINNKCKLNYKNSIIKNDLSSEIISNIKNGTLKEVLSQIISTNKTFIIQEGDDIHLLSTLENNLNRPNFSSLNFGDCEKKLRTNYNIKDTEGLILYEVEHSIEGLNIPIIEYVLFTEDGKTQLNLSICNDMTIKYYIPVSVNEDEIDKYNPSSDFYNNECNKHSTEGGVDMTLYERKNEFNNNNMSLCEKDCTFQIYNTETKKVECDCNIKIDMNYYINGTNIGDLLSKIENDKAVRI